MKIHPETVKEFGTIFIRLGEASVIGGVATYFIADFQKLVAFTGFLIGTILVLTGLFFFNKSKLKEK